MISYSISLHHTTCGIDYQVNFQETEWLDAMIHYASYLTDLDETSKGALWLHRLDKRDIMEHVALVRFER